MQVNVTFLLQIINFCITYFFLEKILLRPLVSDLQKREESKNFLLAGIEKKEEQLVGLQEKKESDLIHFQQLLKSKYKAPYFVPKDMPFIINYERDENAIRHAVDEAKELLLKGVVDAHK